MTVEALPTYAIRDVADWTDIGLESKQAGFGVHGKRLFLVRRDVGPDAVEVAGQVGE